MEALSEIGPKFRSQRIWKFCTETRTPFFYARTGRLNCGHLLGFVACLFLTFFPPGYTFYPGFLYTLIKLNLRILFCFFVLQSTNTGCMHMYFFVGPLVKC
ncbi:hypothetical protein BDZ91DRAFT_731458 [Kalaharituber pfeilii]|nr:hypothetical protein BDZ91DRAFT_731458 [Kalaharituber pfeilii]